MLLCANDLDERPVFEHRHLLNGRALRHGTIYHTALADETTYDTWGDINILTIEVDLESLRAMEMWSR